MTKSYTLRNLQPNKNDIEPSLQWLKELNPQQQKAVLHFKGPSLVIAGAGTGKTKTIVHRVAYLIERGISPQKILLLTFTRRAAEQMISRATQLSHASQLIQGGTFHSFSNAVIREFGHVLGMGKKFTILDQEDSQDRIDFVRNEVMKNVAKVRFPKKSTLQDIFSSTRNTREPISSILQNQYPQYAHLLDAIEQIYQLYQQHKKEFILADYDDLLFLCYDLLAHHESVRQILQHRYSFIMVDEYQDTNHVQAEIIKLLSGDNGNVMVVGDDAQSIYKFRGADFKNILDFPTEFPNAEIYKLEQNYRSTQAILDVANSVMQQAKQKFEKSLFSHKKSQNLPALITAPDDQFQNHFIISKLLDLREEGVNLNEICVLFRNSRNSYSLELELSANKIPFEKRGGNQFTESAHIKDVIAFLKIIQNKKDIVSWNRVLQLLDGIGPINADEIIQQILKQEEPVTDHVYISPKYKSQVDKLLGIVTTTKKDSLSLIEGIISFYRPLFEKKFPDDFPKREKDLEAFATIFQSHQSIETFLSYLALDPIDFTALQTRGAFKDEAPLILSTIHSAKGLEWHSVFIMDLIDGNFPSAFSLNDDDALDEELRLFYVAVTRAKENLYLCYPSVQFNRQFHDFFSNPSRFLNHIPGQLLERWNLETEQSEHKQIESQPNKKILNGTTEKT